MNLDLLKKLTRLANNNPNDHEANSAARRVCKMLEEANFSLNSNSSNTERPNFQHVSTPYGTNYDSFKDIFVNYYKEPKWDKATVDHDQYRKAEQSYYKQNMYYGGYYGKDEQTKPKKEKRTLECKTCKKKVETVFAGLPDVFECNNCQWTAYTRGKV